MITATSLTKRYRRVAAVDGVSFACEPGTITGFLGRNGAGKSTTLRMITGLTRPDAGRATVAGKRFADLPNPARTVGTLLDAAAFHDGRTGRETLQIACTMTGVPKARAAHLLDAVGLVTAPTYAHLDPEGIAWIRTLLRDFAARGGTVLLSSHLLAEVQATADHLVIIDQGRVVASGTQASLLAGTGQTLEELFLSLTGPKETI